jgi:serine/threonine protein kinase
MPVPSTIEDFLDIGSRSGVLDKEGAHDYLDHLRAGAGAPDTPARLAQLMVRDGLLTGFQARQFLKGKWRNFVISGKYVLLEQLGVGGMGTVFLCEHRTMRRAVALKVLPPARADDTVGLERFHREARAIATLNHPNIVKAYDSDRDGPLHFLVMEHVDGSSLQQIVDRAGPLVIDRAAHYISQAAEALQHAHEAGLVHRDVKPANILVDRSGLVKVLDMGLARFFHDENDDLTRKQDSQSVLGTADYIAPEQAVDSHSVDIRADIYGLGVTFYFILTGQTPFPEGTMAQKLLWHQVREPARVTDICPELPSGLAALIGRMMAKDPALRPQTPAEVVDVLRPWTAVPIGPPPAEEMPQRCLALQRLDRGSPSSCDGTPQSGSGTSWKPASGSSSQPGGGPAKAGGPATPLPPKLPASPAHNKVSARRDGTPLPTTVPSVKPAARVSVRPSAPPASTNPSARVKTTPDVTLPEPGPESAPGSAVSGRRARSGTRRRRRGKKRWLGLVLAAGVVLAVLAAGGAGAAWFLLGREQPPIKESGMLPHPGYEVLGVSIDPRAWPRGDKAVLLPKNNFVDVWDLAHLPAAYRLTAPDFQKRPLCAEFTPDGGRLVVGCEAGMLRLFEVGGRNQAWAVDSGQRAVHAVAVTPDGKKALSAGDDASIAVWDLGKGQRLAKWDGGHTGPVHAVALSADGAMALTGGTDGRLIWWDVATGRVRNSLLARCGERVHSICFSADGTTAWVGGADGSVRHWDLARGTALKDLAQQPGAVHTVRLVRGGRTVVTGCSDGHLRAFSASTGWQLQDISRQPTITGLAVTGDGRELLTVGGPSVQRWGIEP